MSMLVEKAKYRVEQGFTLIELMIVIAIIGILAAIAIPQYEQYIATSKATTITQDFHQLVTQGTAGIAAAAAGQTTSVAVPGATTANGTTGNVDGYTFTISSNVISPTNSTFTVTLSGGAAGGLGTAVASAFSSMAMQGSGVNGSSTSTANQCDTSPGDCQATIDSNGGVAYAS